LAFSSGAFLFDNFDFPVLCIIMIYSFATLVDSL
jgi:hypothetical protein